MWLAKKRCRTCAWGRSGVKRAGREAFLPLKTELALTLERRHGLCTGAYPSLSRTSSPPGWFGRALKMKGDRQTDWETGTSTTLLTLPMWIHTVSYWPGQAHIIYLTPFTFSFPSQSDRKSDIECRWHRGRLFRWHCAGTARRAGAPQGARSIKVTYSTDEARIVPAVAQGLQKPIAGINLKVTAVAFGAKHLLIVWREKGEGRTGGGEWQRYPSESNKTNSKELLSSWRSGQASSWPPQSPYVNTT